MVGSVIKYLTLEGACGCLILSLPCLRSQVSSGKSQSYLKSADEVPLHDSVSPASLQCSRCSLRVVDYRIQQGVDFLSSLSVISLHFIYSCVPSGLLTGFLLFFFLSFFLFGHQVNHYPSLVCSSHLLENKIPFADDEMFFLQKQKRLLL